MGTGDVQSSAKVSCMKTNVICVGTEYISHLDGCHVGPDLPTGWASRARSLLDSLLSELARCWQDFLSIASNNAR